MCNPISTRRPDLLIEKGVHLGFEWEVTSNTMAYRCGYIRIPPGHPWHGLGYDDVKTADGYYPDVHGGLTFAEADLHCGKGGPDDAWWLGFDCAHAGDAADPSLPGYHEEFDFGRGMGDRIKDTGYVIAQCHELIVEAANLLDGHLLVQGHVVDE
jgi:hypothetical protein